MKVTKEMVHQLADEISAVGGDMDWAVEKVNHLFDVEPNLGKAIQGLVTPLEEGVRGQVWLGVLIAVRLLEMGNEQWLKCN